MAASAEILVRPECIPAATGLAGWWRGEGSGWDEIAGMEGSISNGVSFVEGRVGNAFRFDGLAGSGVNLGRVPALQRSEFTVEGWLRRASAGSVSQSAEAGHILGADSGGWTFLLLKDGSLSFGRNDVSSVATSPVVLDVEWHHVAVARTASEVRFYLDGQRVATRPYVETFNLDLDYSIGAIFPSGRNAFQGTWMKSPSTAGSSKTRRSLRFRRRGRAQVRERSAGERRRERTDSRRGELGNPHHRHDEGHGRFHAGAPDERDPGRTPARVGNVDPGTIENLAGLLRADLGTIPARSNAVVTIVVRPLLREFMTSRWPWGGRKRNDRFQQSHDHPGTAVRLTVSLEGDVTTTEPGDVEFAVVLNAPMTRTVTVSYATEAEPPRRALISRRSRGPGVSAGSGSSDD